MTSLKFPYLRYLNCVLVIFLSSCAPVYIPNNINTPQFSRAGEVKVGGWLGSGKYNVTVSAAVDNHLAIMVNGAFGSQKGSYEEGEDEYEHRLWEGGIGMYDNFGESTHFDFFAGYGVGYARYEDYHKIHYSGGWGSDNYIIEKKAKGDFNRFFMQTSFSEHISKKLSIGMAEYMSIQTLRL